MPGIRKRLDRLPSPIRQHQPGIERAVQCRLQRRFCFRNERSLYTRKCDFSGKEIISQYHKDTPFPVYDQEIWQTDEWNPMEYGQDFDFSRLFFEQFTEFVNKIPHTSLQCDSSTNENSYYTNYGGNNKNCYMATNIGWCEDCLYGRGIRFSKNCVDCLRIYKCELCYESIKCNDCYNCFY